MQQVARPQISVRNDPAPSRVAYKMQRMMLRPGFKRFLRIGVPFLTLATVGLVVFSNPQYRQEISLKADEFRRAIQERPEFMVNLMAIDGASDDISDEIRQLLPQNFPVTAFDLDLEEMRQTVANLDVVANVVVQVRKGVLQIIVTEREPVMVWRSGDGLMLVDIDGHRIKPLQNRNLRSDLPLITGAGANLHVQQALEIFASAGPLMPRIRGFARKGQRRWDLVLDRDQRILLPEQNPAFALERVIALAKAQDMLARDLTVIDVRNGKRPTIRMAKGAVDALRKIRAQQ